MSRWESVYDYRLPQYSQGLVSGGVLMVISTDVKLMITAIMYRWHQHCLKSLMKVKIIWVKCKWENVRFKKAEQNYTLFCNFFHPFIVFLKNYKNLMCVDQSHLWKLVLCLSCTAFSPTLNGANNPAWVLPQVPVLIFGSITVLLPVVILCWVEN